MDGALLSSTAQVKALVPDFLFKRAKELASSNKLHSVSFQGPVLHKSVATCTGSNPGDSYSLSILLDEESPSKPMCQCSCPAQSKGNLCKHVVALLLLRSKEFAKIEKEQSNVSALSEFKLAEDRLAGDKQKEPAFLDSQATEVFVPSDDKLKQAEEETCATAQSVSPVRKNNQKRVLPSWISEGFCVPKKEANEKVAKKTARKQDAKNEEEGEAGSALEHHRITQRGRGKSGTVDKGGAKKLSLRKRKDVEAAADDSIADSDGEDISREHERKILPRANNGMTQRNADAIVKKGGGNPPKRRRTRGYVESDISEEGEPEVLDSSFPSEAKEGLDLTTEDLVKLANEHLEMERSHNEEAGPHNPGAGALSERTQNDAAASPKKKGSIFTVQGWNEIAAKSLDAKDDAFSQETSEMPVLPLTFVGGGLQKCSSQVSAELEPDSLSTLCGGDTKGADSLEPAENIVDDMLGLIFGPTLSKTVHSKAESRPGFGENFLSSSSMAPLASLAETEMPEALLPSAIDVVPKPKKKGSLKDTIMMFLG